MRTCGRQQKREGRGVRKLFEADYTRATVGDEYDVSAVSKLIKALFPKFIGGSMTDELLRRDLTTYQHVANDEPTKYWERIKRGELYANEIADCEILSALRKWNEDFESKAFKDMEMVEALTIDERIFKKALQFKSLISRDCLQKASSKQFDKTLKEYGNKANSKVCPALTRFFVLKPEYDDRLWRNWLLEEIKKALPISIRYANELYYFWYDPKHNPDGDLRGRVVEEAKKIYENDPALLAKVLDPDYIWSVLDFTYNFAEKDKDTYAIDSRQWMWLGRTLIEASADNTQIIGVHIAAMASSMISHNREKQIEYKDEFYQTEVESIFNNQEYKAMKLLLLEGVNIEKYDETSKKVLVYARDIATKWLMQNNSQLKDNQK